MTLHEPVLFAVSPSQPSRLPWFCSPGLLLLVAFSFTDCSWAFLAFSLDCVSLVTCSFFFVANSFFLRSAALTFSIFSFCAFSLAFCAPSFVFFSLIFFSFTASSLVFFSFCFVTFSLCFENASAPLLLASFPAFSRRAVLLAVSLPRFSFALVLFSCSFVFFSLLFFSLEFFSSDFFAFSARRAFSRFSRACFFLSFSLVSLSLALRF